MQNLWIEIKKGNAFGVAKQNSAYVEYKNTDVLVTRWQAYGTYCFCDLADHRQRYAPNGGTHDPGSLTGLILGLRPANERRRYFVTPFLIGWAQT